MRRGSWSPEPLGVLPHDHALPIHLKLVVASAHVKWVSPSKAN